MSIADAERVEAEVRTREEASRRQQEDIDRETDDARKAQKKRDKEEYDAETAGLSAVARALRQNSSADARTVIPRLRDIEAADVHDLRTARAEARRLGNRERVTQLDRQIELADRTIHGKERALELVALVPPREEDFKYAMKLTIEDDLGRPVAQLAFNLFPSAAAMLVLRDEGHPVPPVEKGEKVSSSDRAR